MIEDLLMDFDEMGFAPVPITACGINPEEYARKWKSELVSEIERLKDENKENCWKCIEAKRVTEEDYAKLQEEFANYQIASDKEMIAQVKQAKIDALNELRNRLVVYYPSVISVIDELLKELIK